MPSFRAAVVLVAVLAGLVVPHPAVAPAPDALEARVAFAVVSRAPDAVAAQHAARALDALAPVLLRAFEYAARGEVRLERAAGVAILEAQPDVAALDAAPARLARAWFAEHEAVDVLVLVSVDLPVAGAACACVAWSLPARAAGLDRAALFGAGPGFLGVAALGDRAVLDDARELTFRFLHELGHVWCCRGLNGAVGAHWATGPASDPLVDGASRELATWRFSARTLATFAAHR